MRINQLRQSRPAVGLTLPLSGHTIQNERFRKQLEASVPLRKQLWQQTIQAKISNQATVLQRYTRQEVKCMRVWAAGVKSGDPENVEAGRRPITGKRCLGLDLRATVRDHRPTRCSITVMPYCGPWWRGLW